MDDGYYCLLYQGRMKSLTHNFKTNSTEKSSNTVAPAYFQVTCPNTSAWNWIAPNHAYMLIPIDPAARPQCHGDFSIHAYA